MRPFQLEFICKQPPANQRPNVLAQKKVNTIAQDSKFIVYTKLNSECANEVVSDTSQVQWQNGKIPVNIYFVLEWNSISGLYF